MTVGRHREIDLERVGTVVVDRYPHGLYSILDCSRSGTAMSDHEECIYPQGVCGHPRTVEEDSIVVLYLVVVLRCGTCREQAGDQRRQCSKRHESSMMLNIRLGKYTIRDW